MFVIQFTFRFRFTSMRFDSIPCLIHRLAIRFNSHIDSQAYDLFKFLFRFTSLTSIHFRFDIDSFEYLSRQHLKLYLHLKTSKAQYCDPALQSVCMRRHDWRNTETKLWWMSVCKHTHTQLGEKHTQFKCRN